MRIRWNEMLMGSGVDSIDDQHRALLDALGDLLCATQQGRARDEVLGMIDFLEGYAANHFAHEETVMSAQRCPVACANKRAHAAFINNLATMRADYEQHGATPAVTEQIQKNLINWLSAHICGCDARLKAHAAGSGDQPALGQAARPH
jgi:hemerythrin